MHPPLRRVPFGRRVAKRRQNVFVIRPGDVACAIDQPERDPWRMRIHTWRLIVADSKERSYVVPTICQSAAGAIASKAADTTRVLPHHLSEMSPVFEIPHRRSPFVVQPTEPSHLIVIEQVRDDRRDVVWPNACGYVLPIPASARVTVQNMREARHGGDGLDLHVVSIRTACRNDLGDACKFSVPRNVRRGVVAAMQVVVGDRRFFVWQVCRHGIECVALRHALRQARSSGHLCPAKALLRWPVAASPVLEHAIVQGQQRREMAGICHWYCDCMSDSMCLDFSDRDHLHVCGGHLTERANNQRQHRNCSEPKHGPSPNTAAEGL